MKKDLCELVVILDESGSMGSLTNDTIGGFNTFLETHQKLPGEALLTLVSVRLWSEHTHKTPAKKKAAPRGSGADVLGQNKTS